MILRERAADALELRFRGRDRDAGTEAGRGKERVRSPAPVLRVERNRRPDGGRALREPECRRHDADDLERASVDADRLADDVRPCAEAPPPESIAYEEYVVSGLVFIGGECPAELWRDTQHRECRSGHAHARDALGLAVARQVERQLFPDRGLFE